MDNLGQIHILEVVALVTVLAIAVASVQQLSDCSVPTTHSLSKLKNKADGVLSALDKANPEDKDGGYSSLLEEFVINGLNGDVDSIENLVSSLTSGFSPSLTLYNIWVYDKIEQMTQDEIDERELLYPTDGNARVVSDSTVRAHKILIHDKNVYDVVLEIWYI